MKARKWRTLASERVYHTPIFDLHRRQSAHPRRLFFGFDDRGVKLSCRGARGAKQDHRLAGRFCQAYAKERAASFVDLYEDFDTRMSLQCHGDRGRARARRYASKLHALHRQLVDEGGGEGLRYIHRIRL